MKLNSISELKKRLYGKHHILAFFDGFRLKSLYKYALDKCADIEVELILNEITGIENNTYSEYSDSKNFSFFRMVRNSFCFFNPDMKLRIDMFGYIAFEMAFLRYKSNHCFLLASYKYSELNEYLASPAYNKLYNTVYNTKDIVSNAFFDLAYAKGDTSMKSGNLIERIHNMRNDEIII